MDHDSPFSNADASHDVSQRSEPSILEVVDEPREYDRPPRMPTFRSRKRLTTILFLATCVSTFVVGMEPGGGSIGILLSPDFWSLPWAAASGKASMSGLLWNGLLYSAAVMGILFTHEMGHYLQSRRHRVPATLPFFIPMPLIPFGTMGAVIVQGAGFADRKKLYDIAISGPLAGLVLAIPITWIGVTQAELGEVPKDFAGVIYGDPLLIQWMAKLAHPTYGPGFELSLNPLLFAGWVGIFVTALNLIPVGQLDGGHILYTLIGRPAHYVAIGIIVVSIAAMIWFQYPAFILLIALLMMMGLRHPPTADDTVPLGIGRIILGWATLAFLIIGFTPMPIIQQYGDAPSSPNRTGVATSTESPVASMAR